MLCSGERHYYFCFLVFKKIVQSTDCWMIPTDVYSFSGFAK